MSTRPFCGQCGAVLAPNARFCGGCGAQVNDGLSENSADSRPQPTASDLVYLFGDSFVSKDNWRSDGIILISSAAKVQKKPLAQTMVLAAVASLVAQRQIELAIAKVGMLMFKQELPVLRMASGTGPSGGLELALYQRIDSKGDWMNSLGQVLGRVVGLNQNDPWENVVRYAVSHLVQTGCFLQKANPDARGLGKLFHSEYEISPDSARIGAFSPQIGAIHGLLQDARARHGRAWEVAAKHVEKALEGCEEKDARDND